MQRESKAIIEAEQRHETGVYPKRPIAIVRGKGAWLWDAEGKAYLDCVAGQGAANLGHAHPVLVRTVQEQATVLTTCPEIFPNDQRAAYLEELTAAIPFPARIFFCNSGAEAVETSLKFARLIQGRPRIVATKRGFHGRTFGALSATWEPTYRQPFEPLVPEFVHVAYHDIAAMEAAVDEATAAVILEPVQGEGGVRPAEPAYLQAVRRLCDQRGVLLLIDEVQTGFGRTGTLFAIEQSGVIPDMLILAKSIAGGLPMGAVAVHVRHGPFRTGVHGSTFGGNPLGCAVARSVLRVLREERLPEQTAQKGQWLLQQLRQLPAPIIREVRGAGLLIGIELRERVQPYLTQLLERGVLALPAGPTVVRLLPPLIISYAELEFAVEQLAAVLNCTTSWSARHREEGVT